MFKKLGTKLSSKSNGSQSNPSSVYDTLLSTSSSGSHRGHGVPTFERQEISPHTLLELRLACAAIVKETGPSGPELDAILNQQDPLELYKREEQHRKDIDKIRLQAARTHVSGFPPVKGARERDRLSKSNLDSVNISTASLVNPHTATQAARKPSKQLPVKQVETAELDSQSLQRSLSRKPIPVPFKEEEKVFRVEEKPSRADEKALKVRNHHEVRHRDDQHLGRTDISSTSTTRSNTTFENHASTHQTSINQTPADNKRSSLQHQARSSSRSQAIRAARGNDTNSMLSETDFLSPNPDYEVPSLYHAKGTPAGPSRARSRAVSIKDSIIGGIRDYIQPRPSMETRPHSRQSRSMSRDGSRSESRSSSMTRNSKEWMRNAASSLRRKGSLNSVRSSRAGDDDDQRGRKGKDKGPDLNRKLPPLPGLDSYKEPKKHIAQLLAKSKFPAKSPAAPVARDFAAPTSVHLHEAQPSPYLMPHPGVSSKLLPSSNSQLAPSSSSQYATSTSSHLAPLSNKMSPESTSSKTFPRIPFTDPDDEFTDNSNYQVKAKLKKDALDEYQQEELRRVVREKIAQGGLSKEQFDAQSEREDALKLKRSKTQTTKQNNWGRENAEADYTQSKGRKSSHHHSGSVREDSGKKSLGGRFSKLLGRGHEQNSIIASH